jgi:predicted O-linked N-acetylglucosamine transferase (SPINDLY family)
MDAIDYRFTDAWADPPGTTEAFHSEQLVRLPETFLCYRPADDAPDVSSLPAIERGHITFGSFNILAKINPPLVALWAEILRRCPKSELLIKCAGLDNPGSKQLLLDLFAKNEIKPDRVDLRARVPSVSAHLQLYSEIDIALDTFPYHGTTTTAEALWMGVPVVTFAGTTHISRVGASIMNNIDLPNLVGNSPEEYVDIAVKLAGGIKQQKSLRSGMRKRVQKSPLLDSKKFGAAVEAEYRSMWQRWCAGSPKL